MKNHKSNACPPKPRPKVEGGGGREKILLGTFLIYAAILLLTPIIGCESPRSSIPPDLPQFENFSSSLPSSAKSQKGGSFANLFLELTNYILVTLESITGNATGPARSGTSWVWASALSDADFVITSTLAPKGYHWDVNVNGTFEPFGYFEDETALDGFSNFDKTEYNFNTYDPDGNLFTIITYCNNHGSLSLDAKTYSFVLEILPSLTFEAKLIIEESQDGTGIVKAFWDNEHTWEAESMFLDLEWWNYQQSGTWETFYNPEVPASFNITDESGYW